MESYLWRSLTVSLVLMNYLAVSRCCPIGWYSDTIIPDSDRCYHYVPTPAVFDDAVRSCKLIGAKLATPRDLLESTILMNIVQTEVPSNLKHDIWVNARRQLNERERWKSTENETTFLQWPGGYIGSSGNCAVLLYENANSMVRPCHHKASFICETTKDSATKAENCDDPGVLVHELIKIHIEGPAVQGTVIYPNCNTNYMFDQLVKVQPVFYCINGKWNGSLDDLPECIVERCPELVIRHLKEVTTGGVDYKSIRNFTCPRGTTFENREIVDSGSKYISVRCNKHGSWDGEYAYSLYDGKCVPLSTTPVNAAGSAKFAISFLITLVIYTTTLTSLEYL